jgi:hypothetical protein
VGFGEEYQDMTEREILIDMAGELRSLRDAVDSQPKCPSPMCGDHEQRLTRLETVVAVVGGAMAIVVPTLLWLIDKVWGP